MEKHWTDRRDGRNSDLDVTFFSPNQQMLLIRSTWDHPPTPRVNPRHNPGGAQARFTEGNLSLGSARQVGTF